MSETRYLWMERCAGDHYQNMIEHGWRRFGKLFFLPICAGCHACLSVRIPVNRFVLSRSQKRVLAQNRETRLVVRRPSLTESHMEIYQKFQEHRHHTRGWSLEDTVSGQNEYYQAFVSGYYEYGYEFAYYHQNRLVAVALTDILDSGLSAVYCYYDPDYRHLSLGTFSVLQQITFAREHNREYLYLGYWVEENRSLTYKSRFQPLEVLQGRPDLSETTRWEPLVAV